MMKHKRTPMHYRPFQFCTEYEVVTTSDPVLQVELYRQTDQAIPLGLLEKMVGITQHPETGLYQVWISTIGFDIVSVSARLDLENAERDLQAIKNVLESRGYYDALKVEALLTGLCDESDSQPHPFPDELVRKLTRDILRMVIERNHYEDERKN